jgi:hypothetical protein
MESPPAAPGSKGSFSANGDYGFRQAHQNNAFHQFPLLDPARLRREAADRRLQLRIDPYEELERLDEAGAFSPLLFDGDEVVFRDEHGFVPWEEYALEEASGSKPRAQPRYSPWQLLYLKDALKLDKVEVPAEWLFDDLRWEKGRDQLEGWYSHRLAAWHALDASWRPLMLLLIRTQGRYGPSIKGTLTKATTAVVYDDGTDDYVDPLDLEHPWDAAAALAELEISADQLKKMYESLAMRANSDDPLSKWYMLFRMAPYKQRERLRGDPRLALRCLGLELRRSSSEPFLSPVAQRLLAESRI